MPWLAGQVRAPLPLHNQSHIKDAGWKNFYIKLIFIHICPTGWPRPIVNWWRQESWRQLFPNQIKNSPVPSQTCCYDHNTHFPSSSRGFVTCWGKNLRENTQRTKLNCLIMDPVPAISYPLTARLGNMGTALQTEDWKVFKRIFSYYGYSL